VGVRSRTQSVAVRETTALQAGSAAPRRREGDRADQMEMVRRRVAELQEQEELLEKQRARLSGGEFICGVVCVSCVFSVPPKLTI